MATLLVGVQETRGQSGSSQQQQQKQEQQEQRAADGEKRLYSALAQSDDGEREEHSNSNGSIE